MPRGVTGLRGEPRGHLPRSMSVATERPARLRRAASLAPKLVRTRQAVGKLAREVTLEDRLRRLNRVMVAFDLGLGGATVLAPAATLRLLGHGAPEPDAEELFRRCGPIWLTFAAAHATAALRGRRRDWWALAWLRGTEIATDALWSRSPGLVRPGARTGLRLAGVANLAMAVGFARLSRR
jgi:hypothetical protein